MINIVALQGILEGKSTIDKFAEEMHAEMKRASELGDYERAKEIRDTLYRLNNLRIKQKMEKAVNRNHDEEYVSILKDIKKGVAHVMALRRTRGVISDRKKFDFDLVGDNSLSSFLLQYYSSVSTIPRFVYVNEDLEDKQVLEMSLEKIAEHKVSIFNVEKTLTKDKRQLMDLIMRNLSMYIERGYDPAVVELKNALKLTSMPEVIDCFDVSNLGISIAVGSCVRFINGKPSKSYYRRFNIRTVVGQNDFAMMGELVRRRYSSTGEKIPDLILIDGGRGQLGAAIMSLRSLGISDVSCISLAKENEEIYITGSKDPVVLPKSNAGLKMLQHARDEAHRFGLAYNIKLRKLR
jgi:excinuclease ABC subunit C